MFFGVIPLTAVVQGGSEKLRDNRKDMQLLFDKLCNSLRPRVGYDKENLFLKGLQTLYGFRAYFPLQVITLISSNGIQYEPAGGCVLDLGKNLAVV